jgi:hypothetical protein
VVLHTSVMGTVYLSLALMYSYLDSHKGHIDMYKPQELAVIVAVILLGPL